MVDWHCGNNISVMRRLPEESIQCCITSPPYWGLRDYGTGVWVGGDPTCNHRPKFSKLSLLSSTPGGGKKTVAHQQEGFKTRVCGNCGAVRSNEVWGGSEDCQHVWGETRSIAVGNAPSKRTTLTGGKDKIRSQSLETTTGSFCLKCNAWMGELGNEPSIGLYIEHLVWVFRGIRRLLKPDGVVWLNIGDSFSGGGGTGGNGGLDEYARRVRGLKDNGPKKTNSKRATTLDIPPKEFAGCAVDARPRIAGRWLVSSLRDYLGQGKRDAGICY